MTHEVVSDSWLSTNVRKKLLPVVEAANRIWKEPLHVYYTDHSVDHSQRILVKLGQLARLLPEGDQLNELEQTVLGAAAYLHDIGMQYAKGEFADPDEARRKHHDMSYRWIVNSVKPDMAADWPSLGLEGRKDIVDDIAVVAKGHRSVDLNTDEFREVVRGDAHIRRRLLAAMLRLADALDLDYRRVFVDRLKTEDVPYESRLHWWKCHFVSAVVIKEDGTVEVQLRLPQSPPHIEHEHAIKGALDAEIARATAETETLLWPHNIRLRRDEPIVVRSDSTQPMPRSDLLALWANVKETWHKLALPEPKYFAAWYRELEEFPSELVTKADALVDSDPFQAAKYSRQAAQEYQRIGFILRATEQAQRAAHLCEKAKKLGAAFVCLVEAGRLQQQRDNADHAHASFAAAAQVAKKRNAPRCESIAAAARDTTLAMMGATVRDFSVIGKNSLEGFPAWLRTEAQYALGWGYANDSQWEEGAHVLSSAAQEEAESQSVVRLLLDAAYMKARAGSFQDAHSLLERVVPIAEPLRDAVPGLWTKVLSRRAHISYLCEQIENAKQGFRDAIQFADNSADVRGRAVNRRNFFWVAYRTRDRAMLEEADWTFGADLEARTLDDYERARVKEYYGLQAHRGGKPRDALFNYYASWRKHIDNGNLVGVQQAEQRMAQLTADIGDVGGAVLHLVNIGAVKELEPLCERLASAGSRQLIAIALESCNKLAVTTQPRVGLCAVVEHLWDFVADEDVDSLIKLIMPWTKEPFHPSPEYNLPLRVYNALGRMAFRTTDVIAKQVCEQCVDALQQDSHWTLVQAQMRCLWLAAQKRVWPDEDVMTFVDALHRHTSSDVLRGDALACMSGIMQPDTQPMQSVKQRLEARARSGDAVCANILVQMPGTVSDPTVLQPALLKYAEQLRTDASVASGGNIAGGGLLISMLGYYAKYLSDEQLDEYTDLLLQTARNPYLLLVQRQSAVEGLRLLVPVIPQARLRGVWDGLIELAFGELVVDGTVQALLASQHPLSSMKFSAGTPSDVQERGRWTLATLAPRIDRKRRSDFCARLINSFFEATDVTVIEGNAIAAGEIFAHVGRDHKRALFLRVYCILGHTHAPVVRTALRALHLMSPQLTKAEVNELARRLPQLGRSNHVETRISVINVVHQLLEALDWDLGELVSLLETMRDDPSWRVRAEAAEALGKRTI